MKKIIIFCLLTMCSFVVNAQNKQQVTFNGVYSLLKQITDDWQLPATFLADNAGLELVLYHCYDEGAFNSLCFGYARNANVLPETDQDYNRKMEKTSEHACVLVVEASTSSGGSIYFSDKADYDRFFKEAVAHGLLQEQGGDTNQYFVNVTPLKGGKVIKVSNQELFASRLDGNRKGKYQPQYMLIPKGKNAQGWYTFNIGIDF